MSEIQETRGIRALMILEIIGKPPEHLTETLNKLIDGIDEEKGVEVRDRKVNEPVSMKEKTGIMEGNAEVKNADFYSNFAEVEVETEEISDLILLMFKYMPASIEILYPEAVVLTNNGWSDVLSEITRRLHGYDEIARVMQIEKAVLEKKLRNYHLEKTKNGIKVPLRILPRVRQFF